MRTAIAQYEVLAARRIGQTFRMPGEDLPVAEHPFRAMGAPRGAQPTLEAAIAFRGPVPDNILYRAERLEPWAHERAS